MEDKSYKTLVQHLPDIVFKVNTDGRFQYVNDAVERLGYTSSELLGRHFGVIIHPDDLPRVQRSVVLERYRGKKTPGDDTPKLFDERREGARATKGLLLRMIKKGWDAASKKSQDMISYSEVLSIGVYANSDDGGRVFDGSLGIVRDITAIRRTESQIVQTERHYRTLIENSTDIITIIAHDGTILFASPSIKRMLGYEPVDVIGDSIADYLKSGDDTGSRGGEQQLAGLDGQHEGIELAVRSRSGEYRTFESFGKRILDDDGNLVCFVVNSRDVTERKAAERELADSEIYLRVLLDSVRTGVLVIEHDTHRIISANAYALEMMGAAPEEVIGSVCRGYICPVTDLHVTLDNSESSLITAGGAAVPVIKNVTKIVHRGKTLLVESFVNIEHRKRMEEQILLSLKEKETLLKEIHHRVKSNMQIITSLLSLQASGIRDESVVSLFREAQGRIMSMALVHELLYRSMDLERINLGEYIRTLVRELLLASKSSGRVIDLRVRLDEVFLNSEKAVPCGLLVNELITNSIKYAFPQKAKKGDKADGSWQSDEGPVIEVNLAVENGGITLEIADNGIGIPRDVDIYNTQSLGLKLVSMLASQLHGAIEVDRKKGTRFRLTFGTGSDKQHHTSSLP